MAWSKTAIRVETLIYELKSGKYNMNPGHQRHIVHNDHWQSGIIQSILVEEDIPEVYFHKVPDGPSHIFESLDGKQRISSIDRYINNEYSYQLEDELNIYGKYFSQVPDEIKRKLNDFEISQKVFNGQMNEVQITRFFQKRQNTKNTNKGEHLNSDLQAPYRDIICHISEINEMIRFQKKDNRMQRMEICVNLLHTFDCWIDPDKSELKNICIERKGLQIWYSSYKINDKYIDLFKKTFSNIINIILENRTKTKKSWSHITCVPIYFWYLMNCINRDNFQELATNKKKLVDCLKHEKFDFTKIGGNHNASMRRYIYITILFIMIKTMNKKLK